MAAVPSQQELIARDQRHVIHPLHSPSTHAAGHVWTSGDGVMLVDADGKRYIDGLSGLWNVVAGHGRAELAQAAAEQMQKLGYCSAYAGSSNPPAIELSERLASLCYARINRFFFTSGGGEATESSIKTARSYWKLRGKPTKTKVISREFGYHGVTLAAMSATGIPAYWPLFEPVVPGFVHIPSPYPYRYQAGAGAAPGSQGHQAADELEHAIEREGADTVAMFIAEPVQGAGGVIVPQEDYFGRIREICDRHDVLFVADEVITGFGRTGTLFALDHWGVQPDIVQFAKAITSGYFPFGGIGVSDEIATTLDGADSPWMHAYTYSAHPVGSAVALRTLDIIEDEGLPGRAADSGGVLLDGLCSGLGDHPHVGEVRGLGMMCAVELVADRADKAPFSAGDKIGARVAAAAMERGLFSRSLGDVFYVAPPLIAATSELQQVVDATVAAVEQVT